jgi:hypothetical protein
MPGWGQPILSARPASRPHATPEAPAPPPAEYATFLGMASPPTSYGGYGGNANERPKYSFEYPQGWKSEVPSKVCACVCRQRVCQAGAANQSERAQCVRCLCAHMCVAHSLRCQ